MIQTPGLSSAHNPISLRDRIDTAGKKRWIRRQSNYSRELKQRVIRSRLRRLDFGGYPRTRGPFIHSTTIRYCRIAGHGCRGLAMWNESIWIRHPSAWWWRFN